MVTVALASVRHYYGQPDRGLRSHPLVSNARTRRFFLNLALAEWVLRNTIMRERSRYIPRIAAKTILPTAEQFLSTKRLFGVLITFLTKKVLQPL